MHSQLTNHLVGRSLASAALLLVSAAVAGAQEQAARVEKTVVASLTTGLKQDDARYIADRNPGSNYSGVVNLWFRNAGGSVIYGCTGSLLTGGKILTAGHCVSNGTSLLASSFTARFFQTGVGWVEVNGTGMAAKTGYSGAVVEENDVGVLTLNGAPPAFARTYSLANSFAIGQEVTLAGYGRTGDGSVGGSVENNQFSNAATLRKGRNKFETTCQTSLANQLNAGNCATLASGMAATKGGIFLADFDANATSNAGLLCTTLGFCTSSVGTDFAEVATAPGDSGGSNFMDDFTVAGVTSFGQANSNGVHAFFGFATGYTCVANVAGNAGCQSNYNWINAQLNVVPEPSTYALVGLGMLAMFGAARRRRA